MLKGVTYQVHPSSCGAYGERSVYALVPEDDDGLYVGDWRIECDRLYHRHPDELGYGVVGFGIQEYDVNDRVCWKCEERCPDGVWFAHKLQQI